jgi:hypothetical protein
LKRRKEIFEVEFVVFIISSLGAVPNKTIRGISRIEGEQSHCWQKDY